MHPTVVDCVEIMLLFFWEIFSVFSFILKASVSSLSYSEIGVDLSRGLQFPYFWSKSLLMSVHNYCLYLKTCWSLY